METLILIPLLIFIITIIIYIFSKIGIKKSNEIQITPPGDLNPLELAYIHNEKVNASDVISLIPYLVDKKYIKMEFPFGTDKDKISNFKIIKNKEYDGDNALERYILDILFEESDIISYYDLCNNIKYKAFFACCTELVNSQRNHNTIFDKTFKKIRKFLNLCSIIGLFIYDCVFNLGIIFMYFIQLILLRAIVATQNAEDTGTSKKNGAIKLKKNHSISTIFLIVVLLIFSSVFLITESTETQIKTKSAMDSILYLVGILIFVLINLIRSKIEKRNKYGEDLYQKILQFKDFLSLTPRESIEAQFNNNKDCYFDIFSYCFVLGMSDKIVSEYDKFFNNVWKILYEATDLNKKKKADYTDYLEAVSFMEQYNKNKKIMYSKFYNIIDTSKNQFLGKKITLKDIQTENYSYESKDILKNAMQSLKKWILED